MAIFRLLSSLARFIYSPRAFQRAIARVFPIPNGLFRKKRGRELARSGWGGFAVKVSAECLRCLATGNRWHGTIHDAVMAGHQQ
jgi:hypothetical protein